MGSITHHLYFIDFNDVSRVITFSNQKYKCIYIFMVICFPMTDLPMPKLENQR